jgi:superfamily II DNA or RNA helicase
MEMRQKIQDEALVSWIKANKRGTLELITGLGKTKIAMEAVKTYPKNSRILFLAEQTDRELELRNEQKKWGATDWKIEFACYQSAYKWVGQEFDLVIADEIHDSLTKEYSKFYTNNYFDNIMGLSATIDRKAVVDEEEQIYKGHLLDKIAPVCYTYSIDDGQMDGTSRKLDVYVISHKLDISNKVIEAGNKTKRFMQTEWGAYSYWDSQFKKALFSPQNIRQYRIRYTSNARAKVLYELPSKIDATKKLLEAVPGKTIIFGNSIDALNKITPNVVSSKNSDAENEKIRKDFDSGKSNIIASFKKLKQGANLVGLDNCIMHSYYSKSKDLIQRIGRLRNNGEIGRVFIFVTTGTQETKWFQMMFEEVDNLNLIQCNNVEDCILKLNNI